ncbi:hypothetical protein RND81_10G044300 [Saponaria officinalis]
MFISLLIQALLTFLAPCRKRCADGALAFGMWLLYLCADSVALFTIGLIASTHDKLGLLSFWTPFLLLHLGGPDTITALALEDNELWHRHALQLVTQLSVSVYVFTQSFRQNHLWLPTLLMFIDGLIKYVERTCALYFASADAFRESLCADPEAGPNYARLMEEYFAATTSHIPTAIQGKNGAATSAADQELRNDENNSTPSFVTDHVAETEEMVRDAYRFYNMFKGLIADAFLSLKDRKVSRDYFLNRLPLEAFRIIEIELNFIYDLFYTKAFLLERKHVLPRLVCFISVITSTTLFTLKHRKNYKGVDVVITYILLAGAIALDLCSIVKLVLSDWWYIIITGDCKHKFLKSVLRWLPKLSKLIGLCRKNSNRWSHSISQYNLLRRFYKDPPWTIRYIFVKRIRDAVINCLYVRTEKVDSQLIKLIVDELQMKSRLVSEDSNAIKEVCSARGNLVLQDDYFLASEYLNPWTMDVDYDESLLIWHVATDICYFTSTKRSVSSVNPDYRRLSKVMSDYMSYLLLRKATMVSPVVGMSEMRFEDTCEEAKKFTVNKRRNSWLGDMYDKVGHCLYEWLLATQWDYKTLSQREQEYMEEFCKSLIEVKAQVRPMIAKGDKSKSVLFDACRLAQQLNMFGEKQWEISSKVWVELLCYAAIRCSPMSHVAQLSRGGELITLVWQLMAHLGLGERFLQNQGFGWTKLIIQK